MSLINGSSGVSKRDEKRIRDAELIEVVRELHHGMTEVIGNLAGRLVNGILAVETQPFPAEGYLTREYGVPVGAVKVVSHDIAETVTVHAAGPQDFAPTNGTGVAIIPASGSEVVPIGGRAFTVYGTPGKSVTLYVFAGAVRPTAA